MTFGSAASLPGPAPEVPLPSFRSFRRNGRLPAVPRLAALGAPERQRFEPALADQPPRGRILIVEDDAALALDVQRLLREAGYLAVGPAASAEESDRLSRQGPLDGAVLDLHIAGGGDIVAESLAEAGIPFVWLTRDSVVAIPRAHAFAPSVTLPLKREELVDALKQALKQAPKQPMAQGPRAGHRGGYRGWYPVPPPSPVWPRIFPPL